MDGQQMKIKEDLIATSNAVRKKFQELHNDKILLDHHFEEKYKPITNSIKDLIENRKLDVYSHDEREVESIDNYNDNNQFDNDIDMDDDDACADELKNTENRDDIPKIIRKRRRSFGDISTNTSGVFIKKKKIDSEIDNSNSREKKRIYVNTYIQPKKRKFSSLENTSGESVPCKKKNICSKRFDALNNDPTNTSSRKRKFEFEKEWSNESNPSKKKKFFFDEKTAQKIQHRENVTERSKNDINWSEYDKILLSKQNDTQFGIRRDGENFKIGEYVAKFHKDNMRIRSTKFPMTSGLLNLLFYKNPPKQYSSEDLSNYKEILLLTNAHKKFFKTNGPDRINRKNFKYTNIIAPLLKSGSGIDTNFMTLSNNPTNFTYWDNPNELVDRLKLLVSSSSAGHTGHRNEIISIIEELREANIIE